MGLLDNLERRLDQLVNGSFNKAFKAEVQPVELAAALQQELDLRAAARDGLLTAPNIFIIELSLEDHERLLPYFGSLLAELGTVVENYAVEQRYALIAPVQVSFAQSSDQVIGQFRIRSTTALAGSSMQTPEPSSTPVVAPAVDVAPMVPNLPTTSTPRLVAVNGDEFALRGAVCVVGRGADCEVVINDSSVSRAHCQIVLGSDVVIRDLGSTNGTLVDGIRATEASLHDGSIIKIGNITLTFKTH